MNLRPAAPDDAIAVACVHVRAWQAAYRGLLPADYLAGLRPEDRARRYDFASPDPSRLSDPGRMRTLVAVEAETVLGFASISAARDHDVAGQGELCALYVEPDCWGRGIGRMLAAAARGALYGLGFRRAVLWVMAGNTRAERFYLSDGWMRDESHRTQQVWSVSVNTVRYSRLLDAR